MGAVRAAAGVDGSGVQRIEERRVLRGIESIVMTVLQEEKHRAAAAAPIVIPEPRGRRARGFRTMDSTSRTEKILAYALLILGSIAFLIPFYFVVNASLKTEPEVMAGNFVALAHAPMGTIDPDTGKRVGGVANYPRALAPDKMDFWPALTNTV